MDLGHARQIDPSMTEAFLILRAFGDRLAEVHISEVNSACKHEAISHGALRREVTQEVDVSMIQAEDRSSMREAVSKLERQAAEVGRVKRYSHIRGNQPRLASLVCPFQRKGRE